MDADHKLKLENHAILEDFLSMAFDPYDILSNSIKASMAQYLINCKIKCKRMGGSHGIITTTDLIQIQIDEHNRCIRDLKDCLEHIVNNRELN